MEELKESTGDTQALQNQITKLQADNANQKETHEAEIKALKVANAVDMALTNAKAKNNTAVKALLTAFLEKAELADDGTVKGLDDEIGKLVKGSDTAFLFDTAAGTKFKGARAAERGDSSGQGEMTLEKFRKLNPVERHTYAIEHPEEYKAMYGGE